MRARRRRPRCGPMNYGWRSRKPPNICRSISSRSKRARRSSACTARAGAECRHNLVYWRGDEYAGIGPGAHGRLDIGGIRHATATEKRPEAWLMRVEASGHGATTDELLNSEERADEFLLMGLRLAEGIDPDRYAALAGRPLDPKRIALLREEGAIT